ncbi:DUF5067 domain-containing protein [Pediococcus pentosaceus]|uniref:DUF5067 domain-containing protein n=1 Tax=Pediococcus pentosaceus TaxID=1255 RepID=UPI0039825444
MSKYVKWGIGVIAVLAIAGIGFAVYSSQNSNKISKSSIKLSKSEKPQKTNKKITEGRLIELTDVNIKVTKTEIIPAGEQGNEYGDKPVIAFWYETTNKSDKEIDPTSAWIATFEAYQDTDKAQVNKLNMGSLPDEAFLDSQTENIKKGATAKNAISYELDSTTEPVVLKATKGYDGKLIAQETISITK